MSTQAALQRRSRGAASSLSNPASTTADSSSTASSSTPSITDRLRRLIDRDTEWDKSELLETIYWMRQALAVLLGPLLGLLGVTGSAGMVLFVAVLLVGVFGWYGKYQQVDVEELGSWQLMSEGSWPAFTLFVVRHTAHSHTTHSQCLSTAILANTIMTS